MICTATLSPVQMFDRVLERLGDDLGKLTLSPFVEAGRKGREGGGLFIKYAVESMLLEEEEGVHGRGHLGFQMIPEKSVPC